MGLNWDVGSENSRGVIVRDTAEVDEEDVATYFC